MRKLIVMTVLFCMIVFALAACRSVNNNTDADTAKDLTTYSFASPAATGIINELAKTIVVTVPFGTNVTALVATFQTTGAGVAIGSTVQISGTTPNDFTNPVAYTVTAADSSTATYTVTVIIAPSSTPFRLSWTKVDKSETSDHLFGIAFGNSNFIAVGEGTGAILTSTDNGKTWSNKGPSYPPYVPHSSIAYGQGTFVAVGAYDRIDISTDDGLTWTGYNSGLVEHFSAIAYGNGLFIASGTNNLGEVGTIVTSADGINWNNVFSEAFTEISSLAYGNGTIIAVGTNSTGGLILNSNDNGITWTKRISGFTHSLTAVTYGNGVFVAVGGGGAVLTSSDNGITWESRVTGITDFLNGIAFGKGVFAVASSNAVLISNDNGVTWVVGPSVYYYGLNNICFGNGNFITVGNYGAIFQSDIF